MKNISREDDYKKNEVDLAFSNLKIKCQSLEAENNKLQKKINEDKDEILALKNDQKKLQDIVIDYMNRQEKAQKIIESTQNLKELEQKRLDLLYKKWEDLLAVVKTNVSKQELDKMSDYIFDFDHALRLVVEGSNGDQNKDKTYAKSVLNRMSNSNNSNKIVKQYVARSQIKQHGKFEEHILEEELTVSQIESQAEKFLNGKNVSIPKILGVGKEVLSIPPKHKEEKKKEGFSLEEALTPKESLSEIMAVFNLDD